MKTNKKVKAAPVYTAEGAPASRISAYQQLQRSILTCMLWEDVHYETGETVAQRIQSLVSKVEPEKVAELAIKARSEQKLRHAPLLLVREMARLETHRHLVGSTLANVIQRPDELSEFVSIYWQDGRKMLTSQIKKGLAAAFQKFNEYSLAKYNQDNAIKLRDVLFLCHPKPVDRKMAALWKRLANGSLKPADTWERELSSNQGEGKLDSWRRLLKEGKLGAMAFMRNLRNMQEAGISLAELKGYMEDLDVERVLPFRFITAAHYAPDLEQELEKLMFRCLENRAKIPGKTIFVVDVSGSMRGYGNVSRHSELTRLDAAFALAMLAREQCEEVAIYATAGNDSTEIHATAKVPPRRGFALVDAIKKLEHDLGGGGIFLTQVMDYVKIKEHDADRVLVLTDEQDCERTNGSRSAAHADAFGKRNYILNISTEANGIAYKKFTHINGWSEAILDYIAADEQLQ